MLEIKENKFDWKNFGWWILKILFLLILNSATFAFIVMKFIDIGDPIIIGSKEIQLDFLDALEFKWRALIYALMLLGWIITALAFWGFIKAAKKRKERIEDTNLKKIEINQKQKQIDFQNKFLENFDKILEGKK